MFPATAPRCFMYWWVALKMSRSSSAGQGGVHYFQTRAENCKLCGPCEISLLLFENVSSKASFGATTPGQGKLREGTLAAGQGVSGRVPR